MSEGDVWNRVCKQTTIENTIGKDAMFMAIGPKRAMHFNAVLRLRVL